MATTKGHQSDASSPLWPFSSWRCLSAPELAANPGKTRGYLQLGLHISHLRLDLEPFHDALLHALRQTAADKALRYRNTDVVLFPHVGGVLPSVRLIVRVDNCTVFESETVDFTDDVNERVRTYIEEGETKHPQTRRQGPPTITVNHPLSPPSHWFSNFPDVNGNAVQTSPWTGFWDVHSPGAELGFHLVHRAFDSDDGVSDTTLASCYVPVKTYVQHLSTTNFSGPSQTLEFSFTVPYVPFAPLASKRQSHQSCEPSTCGKADSSKREVPLEESQKLCVADKGSTGVPSGRTGQSTGNVDDTTRTEGSILKQGGRQVRLRFTVHLTHRYANVWLRHLPALVMPRTMSLNKRLPPTIHGARWRYIIESYRRFIVSPTVFKMPTHPNRDNSTHAFYPLSPVNAVDQALYAELQDMVDMDVLLAQLRFVYHIVIAWYDSMSYYWITLVSWEFPLANILFLTLFSTILILPRGMFSLPFLLAELVVLMRHYRKSVFATNRLSHLPAAPIERYETLDAELTTLARQWHQKPERATFQRARTNPDQEKTPSSTEETLPKKDDVYSEGESIAPSAFFVKTLIRKALSPQTTLILGIAQFGVLPLVIPPLASFHGWLMLHPRPSRVYAKAVKSVYPPFKPRDTNGLFVGLRDPPRNVSSRELQRSKIALCMEALLDQNSRITTAVIVIILTILSILTPIYYNVIFHIVLLTSAYCITIFLLAFCPPIVPFRRALLSLWACHVKWD